MKSHGVNSIISGSPPLYCTLALNAMQGHQDHNQGTQVYNIFGLRVPDYSNMVIERGKAKLN